MYTIDIIETTSCKMNEQTLPINGEIYINIQGNTQKSVTYIEANHFRNSPAA